MLIHQKEGIPRSLYKLDVKLTGSKKISEQLEKYALQIFDNILCFCKDKYHAYPITCAHAVIERGVSEPLLRDEIYLQLIKQSLLNSSAESTLRVWKLLYLVIWCWPPSHQLMPVLTSHVASHSHRSFSDTRTGGGGGASAGGDNKSDSKSPASGGGSSSGGGGGAASKRFVTVMDIASHCTLLLLKQSIKSQAVPTAPSGAGSKRMSVVSSSAAVVTPRVIRSLKLDQIATFTVRAADLCVFG